MAQPYFHQVRSIQIVAPIDPGHERNHWVLEIDNVNCQSIDLDHVDYHVLESTIPGGTTPEDKLTDFLVAKGKFKSIEETRDNAILGFDHELVALEGFRSLNGHDDSADHIQMELAVSNPAILHLIYQRAELAMYPVESEMFRPADNGEDGQY